MNRIDAHQHYWSLHRDDYGWLTPELPVLYRDFLPDDLSVHLAEQKIDGTIVVQAAATLAETKYILGLADRSDSIVGVVGWLNLHDPAYKKHLADFLQNPKFVGIRLMIQEMKDANEVLDSDLIEAIRYLASLELPVDLLLTSKQLPAVIRLLELVPDLRGVIDHIAKPQIADGHLEPWKSQLAQIAANPRIYCKLSGMVTEADHQRWRTDDLKPYIQHAIEIFGPKRIMFGSDWPVCLLAASYSQVVEALEQSLPPNWSAELREDLFGGNAAAFYKL
jgi:L-fuconolactonase